MVQVGTNPGRRAKASPVQAYPWRHVTPAGRGVPGVTDVIDDLGLRADYSSIPDDVLANAAARGSRVHEAIATWFRTGEDAVGLEGQDAPYWEAFCAWREVADPEPLLVEHTMVSLAFPECGGTVDYVGGTSYGNRIIDWKCRAGIENDGLQTAAYARLLSLEGVDVTGFERSSIELKKTGGFKIHPHRDPGDLRSFVAAAITWHNKIKRGWNPEKR